MLSRIRFVETTGSTNSDLLADPQGAEGDWLVARRQEAGRGRHGRRWDTLDGNFFGSTLVVVRASDPPPPSLALVAGLAVIEAVEAAASGLPLSLKWPNDLMLGSAKLAGILLERSGDRIVAGFGVNLAAAPSIGGRETAALPPGGTVPPGVFAPLLAGHFERLLAAWRQSDPSAIPRAWMARAHPHGTRLTVHADAATRISGRFEGIDDDGALRLRRDDGSVEVIRAGDVSLG